jgi:hypothetical protein
MSCNNDAIFQTQLIVTTEQKKERFIYFFRVCVERKKMSGLKWLTRFKQNDNDVAHINDILRLFDRGKSYNHIFIK